MYVTLHLGIMRYVKNFVIFSLIELFSNHNLKETRICIPKSRLVIENLFKKMFSITNVYYYFIILT
jgi:hypothetical protein